MKAHKKQAEIQRNGKIKQAYEPQGGIVWYVLKNRGIHNANTTDYIKLTMVNNTLTHVDRKQHMYSLPSILVRQDFSLMKNLAYLQQGIFDKMK